MLTGRFQLAGPGVEAADEDGRRPGPRAAGDRRGPAGGLDAQRRVAAGADAHPEVRYRDPTQMGKVYLLPGGRRSGRCPASARARSDPTSTTRR